MQDGRASEGLSPPEDDEGRDAPTPQPSTNGSDTHPVAPSAPAVNGDGMRQCRACGATKPDTEEFFYTLLGKTTARCKACKKGGTRANSGGARPGAGRKPTSAGSSCLGS